MAFFCEPRLCLDKCSFFGDNIGSLYWPKKCVQYSISKQSSSNKEKSDFRLPSPRTVREGRLLISYDAERKVGEEMLGNQCALMPDGTGRKVIGKVGGMVVQTNKLRTLPFQKMGNEKRGNWSDLVLYILKRLSILTGKPKGLINFNCI